MLKKIIILCVLSACTKESILEINEISHQEYLDPTPGIIFEIDYSMMGHKPILLISELTTDGRLIQKDSLFAFYEGLNKIYYSGNVPKNWYISFCWVDSRGLNTFYYDNK